MRCLDWIIKNFQGGSCSEDARYAAHYAAPYAAPYAVSRGVFIYLTPFLKDM
jgi:hypothetical protein